MPHQSRLVRLIPMHDPPRAIVGCRLLGVSPQSPIDHLICMVRLTSKVFRLVRDPTVTVTLDTRAVVWPDREAPERPPRVEFYLLAGISKRGGSRDSLQARALTFAQQLGHVLAENARAFRFEPLCGADAIDKARDPFRRTMDGYAVRPPAQSAHPGFSLLGPVDYEDVVGFMKHQPKPTLLTVRVELASLPAAFPSDHTFPPSTPPDITPPPFDPDDDQSACYFPLDGSGPEPDDIAWARRVMREQQPRSTPARFNMEAGLFSPGVIGGALLATTEDELAWGRDQEIAPSTAVRLRNTPEQLSELEQAARNNRTVSLGSKPLMSSRFDLNTISRLLALPQRAPWLGVDPPPGSFRALRPLRRGL